MEFVIFHQSKLEEENAPYDLSYPRSLFLLTEWKHTTTGSHQLVNKQILHRKCSEESLIIQKVLTPHIDGLSPHPLCSLSPAIQTDGRAADDSRLWKWHQSVWHSGGLRCWEVSISGAAGQVAARNDRIPSTACMIDLEVPGHKIQR